MTADDVPDGARLVVSSIPVPVNGMPVEDVTPIAVSEAATTPQGDDTP